MLIKQVKKLSPLERMLYWIQEREMVRIKKEIRKEPKPWTDDTILQSYRFCNVRRMDDKVSRWLYDNWYCPNFNHHNMLRAVALARFINKPSSLAVIGFPKRWIPANVSSQLRAYRDRGNTVFNGAYVVRGNDGQDKISSVVDYYVDGLNAVNWDTTSMAVTHAALQECYGFGSFMAGQVVADLRWAVEGTWTDKDTWAPIGPGSKRGMNRLLSRPLIQKLGQAEFLEQLQELMFQCRKYLPKSIWSRLEAHDYQNCCCEFDKYERTLFDDKRPKQLYQGTN